MMDPHFQMTYDEAACGGSDLTAMLEVLAEPVAWMTYDIHGAQMVWTDYEEACVYCDDDEQPIPLYMPSNAQHNRPASAGPG